MNARFLRIAAAAVAIMTSRAALSTEPFGLPDFDELTHAAPTIGYYIVSVRPWWRCSYDWKEERREGHLIVYRVTFAGDQKCSRSKRTEYFDLYYSRKLDKVIKMVPAKK
jgi:hypothetical protein